MHIDFKDLENICPNKRRSNGTCKLLGPYDCSKKNCPLNNHKKPPTIEECINAYHDGPGKCYLNEEDIYLIEWIYDYLNK